MIDRKRRSRWPTRVLPLLLAVTPAILLAQEEAEAPVAAENVAPEGEAVVESGATQEEDFARIDELLQMDEEVLADPGTYSYDPGARRDPFQSLVQSKTDAAELSQRPDGVPGLLIDEIEIQGVFMLEGGPVAQIMSASQRTSFLLRPGDQLWDGEVVDITMQEVIFKQAVNDPTALKPFREVVKQLNP